MRKLLPILISVVFLLSCGDDINEIIVDQKGSLKITYMKSTDKADRETSASPYITTLVLTDAAGVPVSMQLPADGIVKDLEPGNYTVSLSLSPVSTDPSFEVNEYSGSTKAVVEANKQKDVEIKCEPTNAGIYFTYDESLAEANLEDIIPILTQSGSSLEFRDDNKNKTGYFNEGDVILSLSDGSDVISIGDNNAYTIKYAKNKLIHIKLHVSKWNTGNSINLEVTETNIETSHEEENTIGILPDNIITFPNMKGIFYGDMFDENYDNFSIYLYSDGVTISENFAIGGTGDLFVLDLYVPITGEAKIAPEHYKIQLRAPGEYSAEPGEMSEWGLTGSFLSEVLADGEDTDIFLKSGDVYITQSGNEYTIAGYVYGADNKKYEIHYTGEFGGRNTRSFRRLIMNTGKQGSIR